MKHSFAETTRTRKRLAAAVCLAAMLAAGGRAEAAEEAKPPADGTVILDSTSLWRQFQVAGASHYRDAAGKLVRCEVHEQLDVSPGSLPREFSSIASLQFKTTSKAALWSAPPPSDWAGPAFDDVVWPQAWLPQPAVWYRFGCNNLAPCLRSANRPCDTVLVLARGKFEVKDPAQVRDCVLSLEYWGGVVVYVNGKEVARGHLSKDAANADAVAEDYPPEAFLTPDGKLLTFEDEKNADRLAQRVRRLRDVKIPAALLQKGVNVVAIEAHAAPLGARELLDGRWQKNEYELAVWPPIGILGARVTVSPSGAAVANVPRPRGVQVWNREVSDTVTPFDYGDPTEPLRPITINAGRNTVFSGRLVVGSDQPIKGLKARVSDLAQAAGGAKIPASAVRVRYAVTTSTPGKTWLNPHRFDGLLEVIPAEIPVITAPVRRPKKFTDGGNMPSELAAAGWQFYSQPVDLTVFTSGAVAPLWFTVRVPKDAAPGLYEGTVSVEAEGLRPTTVPLRVQVSAWTARDPKDFRLQLFPAAPMEEAVASQYEVPLWSDRHFELMGKSLALGTEINARMVLANLAVRAGGGESTNPESLVRWIKQPDGSFKHDFTIFDKYLDMVAKSIGKPHPLMLGWMTLPLPKVSVFDPKTGKVEDLKQPEVKDARASLKLGESWQTKEAAAATQRPGDSEFTEASAAFWKPVIDEVRKKLAARGWTDETILAYTSVSVGQPPPVLIDVANKLWPGAEWGFFGHGHDGANFLGTAKNVSMKVRLLGVVCGAGRHPNSNTIRKTWEPPSSFFSCQIYRNDGSAGGLGHSSFCDELLLMEMRWRPEDMLRDGVDGWASFGLDGFPIKNPSGGYYGASHDHGSRAWHCAGKRNIWALLYPGPDGPVATERYEAFREGLQLTEALLDIEQAVAENPKRPLGAELLQRATRYRDERSEAFAYGWFGPRSVQSEDDRKRLELAADVAKARK